MPIRRRTLTALGAAALVMFALATAGVAAAAPLAIYVNGNHFVNQDGNIVRLTGTGATSSEYACEFGYAYGNYDPVQEADAMAAWHSNATRIPLNQDCWLGTHGYPTGGFTAAGYRDYVQKFVDEANKDGMYVILDLHFSGLHVSTGQRQMPDADSLTFWKSVATMFAANHAVVFDAFNEPLSSTDSGAIPGSGLQPVSWDCWKNGGCTVSDYDLTYLTPGGANYTSVGMQQIVNTIRSAGATQPIIMGGLDYSGDLSQWLSHEPTDSVTPSQLAASFHQYDGPDTVCQGNACLGGLGDVLSVAAHVPVVTGEFGYLDGDSQICTKHNDQDFANEYMNWADMEGISYLAFAWVTPMIGDNGNGPEGNCTNVLAAGTPFSAHLINADGTPAVPLGTEVHSHLAAVVNVTSPGPGVPTITSTGPPPPPPAGGTLTTVSASAGSGGSVQVTLSATGAGSFTATAGATITVGRRKHKHKQSVTYGRGSGSVDASGAGAATLTPLAAALSHLRGGSNVQLKITVTYTATGSTTPQTQTATVRVRVPKH